MLKAILSGAVMVATAAIAQAPSDTQTTNGPNGDLKQIVCVNERVTGSRVSTRRVCRTRAEWAEHEAEQRRTVDRAQSFKPVVCGEAGSGTRNSC
jgi:hypothetical protein